MKDDLPAGERMVAMRKSNRKVHWSDAGGSNPQVLVLDGCSETRARQQKISPPPARPPDTAPARPAGGITHGLRMAAHGPDALDDSNKTMHIANDSRTTNTHRKHVIDGFKECGSD